MKILKELKKVNLIGKESFVLRLQEGSYIFNFRYPYATFFLTPAQKKEYRKTNLSLEEAYKRAENYDNLKDIFEDYSIREHTIYLGRV